MSEKAKLLKVENLAVQYTSGGDIVHAVNGVSFELDEAKTLAIVGETGAGKTTIAKSILRILPSPQAKVLGGCIKFNGADLLQIDEAKMRNIRGDDIAMIFQDPMTSLNPVMTVGYQIAEVLRKHNKAVGKSIDQLVKEMFEMVGIPSDRSNEYPHQFSGGMKQRVVIAMALACNPRLILADEPTSALDVTIQAQILEMIARLREEHNTSLILITHDLGIVAEAADSVAIVYAGEILEYGAKEAVFRHPSHPYTIGLFGAIPNLAVKTRRLANIEGQPPDPSNLPAGCCFNPRCPYAKDICRKQKFPMKEIAPGHFFSCGYPKNKEAADGAVSRN